jgi:hypothetical protein
MAHSALWGPPPTMARSSPLPIPDSRSRELLPQQRGLCPGGTHSLASMIGTTQHMRYSAGGWLTLSQRLINPWSLLERETFP